MDVHGGGASARRATEALVGSRQLFFELFGDLPDIVPEARIALESDRQAIVEDLLNRYPAVAVRGIRKGSVPCRIMRDAGQVASLPRGEVILQGYLPADQEMNCHWQISPSGSVREFGICDRQVIRPGVVEYRFPSEASGRDLSQARQKTMLVACEYAKRGARGLITVKTVVTTGEEPLVLVTGVSTQAPDRRLVNQREPQPAALLAAEFGSGRTRREIESCIFDLAPFGKSGVQVIAYNESQSRGMVVVGARSVEERNRLLADVVRRLKHVFPS